MLSHLEWRSLAAEARLCFFYKIAYGLVAATSSQQIECPGTATR